MENSFSTAEELLPLVYAAASNNGAWLEFCTALNQLTGAPAILFSHDVTTHKSLGLLGSGWDPDHLSSYEKHYGNDKINPWMDMNNAMPIGFVGVSDAAMTRDQLFKTEFYNDWLRPQENLVVGAATICYRKTDRFLALSSACRKKNADKNLPEIVRALEVLGPHVARTIELSSVLMNGSNGSMAHLRASRHAIITIRKNGGVCNINPAAEKLLRRSPSLSLSFNGKLTMQNDEARHFISSAITAMQQQSFDIPLQPMLLRDAILGKLLVHAHIFPQLEHTNFPETVWNDPLIGCFIISGPNGLEEVSVIDILTVSFRATPAEAKLGQSLMADQSLYEYAEQNSLSHHTVRNQMRALLAKTGSRNQAAFVLKVAGLISPFCQSHAGHNSQ